MHALPCSFLLGAALIGSTAAAATFTTRVEGLPPGLQVSARGEFAVCSGNGVGFVAAGSALLQEQTFTTIEPVTLPGGQVVFVTSTRSVYVGSFGFTIPVNNGCGAVPPNAFRYTYSVAGQDTGGNPRVRTTRPFGATVSEPGLSVRDELRAATMSTVTGGVTPTQLRIGIQQTFVANYRSPFGGSDVVSPVLELTRTGSFNGIPVNFTVLRALINARDEVCLTVSGATQCRSRSQGGVLTVGAASINVGSLATVVSTSERRVNWPIRLNQGFSLGDLTLVTRANDFDRIEYIVHGEPTTLDLLPWQAMRIPVQVTN